MEQPNFALIPSGFKSQKVYSVLPESGVGDLLFDRSNNTATRINKDGLIESVLADVPRLNYEVTNGVVDSCPHLLLEMNSTNCSTNSENPSSWSYTEFGSGSAGTITTGKTDMFGRTNAVQIDFPANAENVTVNFGQTTSTISSGSVAVSVYIKLVSSGSKTLQLRCSTGVKSNVVVNTKKFVRYEITGTKNSNEAFNLKLRPSEGTSSGGFSIVMCHPQEEAESYATSYIPTSGSEQTRASESCTGAGDVNTFNSVEGILYAEMKRDIATDNGFRRVNINDGSLDNTVRLGYSTVTNEIKGVVTIEPSTSVSLVFTGLSVTEFRKMALLYKANRIELWVDGSKRAENTITSVTFPANTLNDLSFQHSNGSDKLRAKVKDVRYYDTDGMSNTEITNLLTQLTQ